MRERFAATATALLEDDPRVAIVLADISLTLFREASRRAPERVVNVGIMEQTMIGVAAGFALEGFHPIVHSIAPFLAERPYEQVKLDLAYQDLGATLVSVGASYDYATEGGTHHAPGDVQALLAIPGLQVLVPGHADELDRLLRITYADGRPTYIRASVATNDEPFPVEPGRLEIVRRGRDGTVVAFGPMLSRTLAAVAHLDVDVLYATSVAPFDGATLARTVVDPARVIVVEPFYEGTGVPSIASALAHVPSRITAIGVPRRFVRSYGTTTEIERSIGLDMPAIRRRVAAAIGV